MSGFRLLPMLTAVAVGLAGCATKTPTVSDDAHAVALSVIEVEKAAVIAKDATVMANLYVPDGLLQNGARLFKGRDAIRAFREAGFKAGIYKEDITLTDATIVGDVIYDVGEFTVYVDTPDGQKQFQGRWGGTLVRTGSEWKIGMVTIAAAPPRAP